MGKTHEGKVLIAPPDAKARLLKKMENIRNAMISGWALDDSAIYRYQYDAALLLSDHANHGELIEHVEEVGTKKSLRRARVH